VLAGAFSRTTATQASKQHWPGHYLPGRSVCLLEASCLLLTQAWEGHLVGAVMHWSVTGAGYTAEEGACDMTKRASIRLASMQEL
jgi:hypothetical protein